LEIATDLRKVGKSVEIAFGDRGLKGAMKAADKSGARYVVVLGDEEMTSSVLQLKNMSSGIAISVTIASLADAL